MGKKVLLVSSSGGHLTHLLKIIPVFKDWNRTWVTFDKEDAISALNDEQLIFAHFPTNRNIVNLIRNFFLAIKVIKKLKPDLIISSGAGVAVPFFYVGKLFGAKLVYIEVFDRTHAATLTGRMVHPITDKFIVQWPSMTSVYKHAKNFGSIF
ncbi:PssD/Cps14F family polysaccharide biosynthesis glycosyltransferase [Lacticaseibacillus paracasei]|uniref:PssD/Cps14F family polysaccharide biosynthesis glycosyltransferase n=1 Tax=Lacticaseibacillus paracasei TaxID=1597 RepID=UPI001F6058DA|nr:PssD/Cps14F family polysaccharide biosynthesis glycosyltransferase [Lacticaseibacillus paracasei]